MWIMLSVTPLYKNLIYRSRYRNYNGSHTVWIINVGNICTAQKTHNIFPRSLLWYFINIQWPTPLLSITILLSLHGAHAVTAFSQYYYSLSYIFQIFSSNLSNLISRGGINLSLCRSNSLGASHSTQGQDDFSSSSTTGEL